MECHDIRVLLALERREGAIDPTERAVLQQHLDACPDCAALTHSEQVVDAAFGQAMRAVTVPAGLQTRLLTRLSATRPRRWPKVAAAAAAMLLLIAGGTLWGMPRRPQLDNEIVANEIDARPPRMGPDEVERWYAQRGITMTSWREADHQYLSSIDIVPFRGRRVPKLIFIRDREDQKSAAVAQVWVLATSQFEMHNLQAGEMRGVSTISVEKPGSDYVYVIATNAPADRDAFLLAAH